MKTTLTGWFFCYNSKMEKNDFIDDLLVFLAGLLIASIIGIFFINKYNITFDSIGEWATQSVKDTPDTR